MTSCFIESSFSVSTFRLWSFLVIPQIFLKTDISKTFNFCLCSSFIVHVSELCKITDWTSVRCISTFVDLLMSFAFQILWSFLTIPIARPILLSTFLLHDASSEMTSPKYMKSSLWINWLAPSVILIFCLCLPMHWTSVFAALTSNPDLLLVVWTLSSSCCRSSSLSAIRQISSAKRRSGIYYSINRLKQ